VSPGKVLAPDATRLGFLPGVRRRMTACGMPPVATVPHQCEHCSRSGAVEPPTGARCLLALPSRHSRACQRWLDGCAATVPEVWPSLVLDHGTGHTAKAVRWPANGVAVLLPPYSPARNPMKRLWRDRKNKRADVPAKPITALSDALWSIIPSYSPATLHSLTHLTYFVQAVETVQKVFLSSSLP
jgi:DDE superfamily endonuclease